METHYIHVPGDFNSLKYLIDIYRDNEKIAKFTKKMLKQNQIDGEFNADDSYKPDAKKAMIKFTE